MRAHLEHNTHLTDLQKAALQTELPTIDAVLEKLAQANAPYVTFLDSAYVQVGAEMRVANFLCDYELNQGVAQVRARRKEAEKAVPGILSQLTANKQLNRVLRAGHATTVEVVKGAADAMSLLPASFPFAAPISEALDGAADRLGALLLRRSQEIDPRRAPLRTAVQKAELELRETLYQVNGRLRTHFTEDFIDSLYPKLDRRSRKVEGAPDEDDENESDA